MRSADSYKLLIVDDESGIRESLKDFFELEGFQVMDASGGMNALELIKTHHFDVILSDIRMPEGDGRFLLKSVREKNPSQPLIILMSGFSDVTPEEAYAEGAIAVLTKPFNPVEVMEKVKFHLQDQDAKWETSPSTKPQNKMKIQAPTISQAIQGEFLSCGQKGVFLKVDPAGYRVGQDLEIEFSDSQLSGIGIIRWVRSTEAAGRAKGIGLELKSLSDEFKKQFLNIIETQKTAAIIPRT